MLLHIPVRHSGRCGVRRAAAARALFCILLAGLLAACSTIDREWDVPLGKPYKPANFVASGPIPAEVRRVAVLPMHSEEWSSADVAALDAAMSAELGKFDRFEVIPVSRDDLRMRFQRESFLSSAALPVEFIPRLRTDFGVDAVLFIDLTHFSPYQPISMGVRAKLVSFGGAPLWSFDSVFDSSQPNVVVAARKYHVDRSRPAYPLENTSGILQSPARYAKYVAHAMFETLPLRELP